MVKKKQTNKTVKKQDIFVSVVVGVDCNYLVVVMKITKSL